MIKLHFLISQQLLHQDLMSTREDKQKNNATFDQKKIELTLPNRQLSNVTVT